MSKNISCNGWKNISYNEKVNLIESIIDIWKQDGNEVKYDASWFYEAIEASMIEGEKINLLDKMNLIALMGNVFGKRDELIQKLLRQITKEEFEIYHYVEERFNYYDTKEGYYSGDKYFYESIKDGAKKFNLSNEEIRCVWDKVDKAKCGVE